MGQQVVDLHQKRTLPILDPQLNAIPCHSNDYLNLSTHQALIDALQLSATQYGIGSTGSRLLSGHHSLFAQVEKKLASFMGYDATLIFNSGFQLNSGFISSIVNHHDLVIADKYIHASLIDGIQLSKATFKRFRHNDISHLATLLTTHRKQYKRCLLVTESLFSMDGDRAPLQQINQLAEQFDCEFMVDEAHAIGALGPYGKGLTAQENVKPTYLIGTFGKSFGTHGAFLAGSQTAIDHIINNCRSFIYTTALPRPIIATIDAALTLMPGLELQRHQLKQVTTYFKQRLNDNQLSFLGEDHIISILYPGNEAVLAKKDFLNQQGILVSAIRHPTVPKGTERLRFSLTANLTFSNIDYVVEQLST